MTKNPTLATSETASGLLVSSDSSVFLDTLLARMDIIAEQALSGLGLDPRAREALELAPLSPQAQAFRSKLTAALAEKACELAESDPEAADQGLAQAARMLGTRHARIEQNRALASVASAYPTLKAILASKMGTSALSIAAKARKAREKQELEEEEKENKVKLGKTAGFTVSDPVYHRDEDAALAEILGRLREHAEQVQSGEPVEGEDVTATINTQKTPKPSKAKT